MYIDNNAEKCNLACSDLQAAWMINLVVFYYICIHRQLSFQLFNYQLVS